MVWLSVKKSFSVQTKGLFSVEAKYLFQPFSTGVL